jgi:hypothetical protein
MDAAAKGKVHVIPAIRIEFIGVLKTGRITVSRSQQQDNRRSFLNRSPVNSNIG